MKVRKSSEYCDIGRNLIDASTIDVTIFLTTELHGVNTEVHGFDFL
jgi:hypothetical protein